MADLECRKCHKRLATCPSCDGRVRRSFLGDALNCTSCQNTGLVCPSHDGHWK